MRKFAPISYLLLLLIMGCDAQRGHFSTTGDRSTSLSQVGLVDIVEGHSNDKDAPSQDLMYVLVVCPGVEAHGSSSGIKMEQYLTILNYSWNTGSSGISVQVQWNRDSDIVSIGDKSFARDKGNVFVVRREAGGKIAGQQLSSLGMHAAFPEVLRHAQQELTNDQLIASLKLNK